MAFVHVINNHHVVVALGPGNFIHTDVAQACWLAWAKGWQCLAKVRFVDVLHRFPAQPQMPGSRLDAHMAAQAADKVAKPVGGAAAFVHKATVPNTPLMLTGPHLGQLNVNQATAAYERHIPHVTADMAVDLKKARKSLIYGLYETP